MQDVPARIAELRQSIVAMDDTLERLASGDRPALAAAAASARAAIVGVDGGKASSPEAAALAQAWLGVHQRLRGLESKQ